MKTVETLAELRDAVGSTFGKKLPRATELYGQDVFVRNEDITVYQNGFFTLTDGNNTTVYAVDRIRFLCYGTIRITEIDNLPWPVVLEKIGSDRLEHNTQMRMMDHIEISIFDEHDEFNAAYGSLNRKSGVHRQCRMERLDPMDELIETIELEERIRLLPAAKSCLTESESAVIALYYDDTPRTEREVGALLGISQQAVHKARVRAEEKMYRFYQKEGC